MFLIVANAIHKDPQPSGAGALIILAGIPLYAVFARRQARAGRVQAAAR
jgi:hypothetical protein